MLAISIVSLFLAWVFLELRFTNKVSFLKRRVRTTFDFKTDGSQPSDTVSLSNRKKRRVFKRTPSTRSTLRLVNGNKGEHEVLDTSSRRNGPTTRKAVLTRRKSSAIVYERKLAFYRQLSQMVRVVRRMSEVSVSDSLGLQMALSVASISEEQKVEGAGTDADEVEQGKRKRWASDRVTRTHTDEEFRINALNSKTVVDGAFDAVTKNHPVKKRSKSEPPRKTRRQATDECDSKESNGQAGKDAPEMKHPSARVRKISIVEDPEIEKLELPEDYSAAPKSSEVNPIACYSDLTEYRSLVDTLTRSSEEYSDKSEPGSVQSFLASDGGSETRL